MANAPNPYPTLLSNNGAYHSIDGIIFLGNSVDIESNGQPGATSSGDDLSGTDDEDGVTFPSSLNIGTTVNINIISAEDGIEALRTIRKNKPVLALVEDVLPRLDGYKLARLIKFDNKFRRVRIFIITQAIMEEYQELSQLAGAEGILAMNDINIVEKVKSYYQSE